MKPILNYIRDMGGTTRALGVRGLFNWMTDEKYLRLIYWLQFKKVLDLSKPQNFSEKLQWLKLYDRNPEYTKFVDKFAVREYVKQILGNEYLIPLLGVWEKYDDIPFDKLPNCFVLKCTHDSGSVCICKDKNTFNFKKARKNFNKAIARNAFYVSREWPYKNVRPRIIAEEYMKMIGNDTLIDYKFFCFHGEPKFLYISQKNELEENISFITLDWKEAPFRRSDYNPFPNLPKKPDCFHNMIEISKILSKNIPFVRVDLYEINKKPIFSELTFTPTGGFMPIVPKEWDIRLGNYLNL